MSKIPRKNMMMSFILGVCFLGLNLCLSIEALAAPTPKATEYHYLCLAQSDPGIRLIVSISSVKGFEIEIQSQDLYPTIGRSALLVAKVKQDDPQANIKVFEALDYKYDFNFEFPKAELQKPTTNYFSVNLNIQIIGTSQNQILNMMCSQHP